MEPIFVIVGGPAAGKSTTARALAAAFGRGIHIPVDDLRNMVQSGLLLPAAAWSDALAAQVALARRAALDMARRYREAGFAVVIDDFIDPRGLAEYSALRADEGVVRVVLRPDPEVARERNRRRAQTREGQDYLDAGIHAVYQELDRQGPALARAGWMMLDNTELSVAETVERILAMGRPAS